MRAIEVNDASKFALVEASEPELTHGNLLVQVSAVSINRGEVLRARAAGPGFRPGWDFAGVVLDTATAAGPAIGTAVAGYVPVGAWAEKLAVAPRQVAPIPDGIDFNRAASLPVAGLTALGAIDAGGNLVGRKVLVTGATGGVGSFAVYLAALSGAEVTAVVRRSAAECRTMFPSGTRIVSTSGGLDGVGAHGPFDLIVEILGGATLGEAMTMLTHAGKCVTLGVTDRVQATFDAEQFFMTGTASLEGYVLFRDRKAAPAEGMTRLLRLVEAGGLGFDLGLVESWENAESVAERLIKREFLGKAVLTVGAGGPQ